MQDEITQEIVTAMAVTLTAGDHKRIKTIETDNLEAYGYFLRGREYFWLRMKEDKLPSAVVVNYVHFDPECCHKPRHLYTAGFDPMYGLAAVCK